MTDFKKVKILNSIENHLDFLQERGISADNIFGIFLYGSQNYKIDTENSDVDTKAIYIPTLYELAFEDNKNRNYILDNGEHCTLIPINNFVKQLSSQNINCIEVLFTDYKIINPKFDSIWKYYFLNNRERIVRCDEGRTVHAAVGQGLGTLTSASGKKYANALRLLDFLEKFLGGQSYELAMIPSGERRQEIMNYKTGLLTPTEQQVQALKDKFLEYREVYKQIQSVEDSEIKDFLKQVSLEMILNLANENGASL